MLRMYWGSPLAYLLVHIFNLVVADALSFVGCFVVRDDPQEWGVQFDLEECMHNCTGRGHAYSGVWKRYCTCAMNFNGLEEDPGGCTFPCSADVHRFCGGPEKRISVYGQSSGLLPLFFPPYAWGLIAFSVVILLITALTIKKALGRNKTSERIKREYKR